MPEESVDNLRKQLRERGYLTRGIERWFALDPWSSRTFWAELFTVALKAAVVIALFGALPPVTIMTMRNHPLSVTETLLLTAVYGSACLVVAFAFVVCLALLLKLRPAIAVDTPKALLAISLLSSALLTVPLAIWWYRFDAPPNVIEAAAGLPLAAIFFVMTTIVLSAALLSFSVYELRRIPVIHQAPRTIPLTAAAVVILALLLIGAFGGQQKGAVAPPPQVVVTPTTRNLALVAVDGLTADIFRSRPGLTARFVTVSAVPPIRGGSATERWASVGTGVSTSAHHVRAIEGIVFRGQKHVLQSLSSGDLVLRNFAELPGLAHRQPLPPTVRKRDYVWEIFAARALPSVAVNWWTTESLRTPSLEVIGQESIFGASRGDAVSVDTGAARRLLGSIARDRPRFATVYLPGLDVVLNRLDFNQSVRLTKSVALLDQLASTVASLKQRGYEIVLVGLPGEGQEGSGVVATSFASPAFASPLDVAPTLCNLLGFPASDEMPGRTVADPAAARIASYGTRAASAGGAAVNREYYESLRSLGYIQ